jgi:replication factor C small subunit
MPFLTKTKSPRINQQPYPTARINMKQMWTETYRPKTVNDYVFRDDAQREQVQSWIDAGSIPHLLFSGAPGVGKTTLAKILINQLGIDNYDVLEINASRENSVEIIRDKITGFVQTMPFGAFKVVLLDEADYMSPHGQAALRGVMEMYHETARFILTCNYPHKIIPALHSRCQGFHIEKIDQTEFTARVATILVNEGVEFELDVLDTYVRSTYPDLRKCINNCQMNSTSGKLIRPSGDEGETSEYLLKAIELFKAKRIKEARTLLCKSVSSDKMPELITWAHNNLDLWGTTDEQQDQAIVVIRNAAVNASFIADHEINVSAMLTELSQLQTQ